MFPYQIAVTSQGVLARKAVTGYPRTAAIHHGIAHTPNAAAGSRVHVSRPDVSQTARFLPRAVVQPVVTPFLPASVPAPGSSPVVVPVPVDVSSGSVFPGRSRATPTASPVANIILDVANDTFTIKHGVSSVTATEWRTVHLQPPSAGGAKQGTLKNVGPGTVCLLTGHVRVYLYAGGVCSFTATSVSWTPTPVKDTPVVVGVL